MTILVRTISEHHTRAKVAVTSMIHILWLDDRLFGSSSSWRAKRITDILGLGA